MKKDYLSENEVTEIEKFNSNEVMREAVKKVLLESVYRHGVLVKGEKANTLLNFTLTLASKRGQFSDAELGADLRASWNGINLVESGFSGLEKIKNIKEEPIKKVVNKAR